MHGLEMPETLSGLCIEGNEAVAEEIVPLSIATVEIITSRAEGHENDTFLPVDREFAPIVNSTCRGQILCRPCLRTEFSRTWNAVESPLVFARQDIEGANVPWRRTWRIVAATG